MTCLDAVEIMRGGEHQGADDRKRAIRRQAQLCVCYRSAQNQQDHAQYSHRDDANAAVAAEPKPEGEDAERQHDDEHLCVQVALGKPGE